MSFFVTMGWKKRLLWRSGLSDMMGERLGRRKKNSRESSALEDANSYDFFRSFFAAGGDDGRRRGGWGGG